MKIKLITIMAALGVFNSFAAVGLKDLATVNVRNFGTWKPLAVGELVVAPNIGTGPSQYWKELPPMLQPFQMDHYFLQSDPRPGKGLNYNTLEFEATSNGRVWLMALARPDNEPPLAELAKSDWRIVTREVKTETGYEPYGKNNTYQNWVLLERFCVKGEKFSLNNDTYQSPVILRPRQPSLKISKPTKQDVTCQISGNVGVYKLQTSTDLVSWISESDVSIKAIGSAEVAAISQAAYRSRFYRLELVSF